MAGRVLGWHFKTVIGSLLGAKALFPEHARRVAAMQDGEWYEWDEFLRLVNDVASKLEAPVVSYVGAALMKAAKPFIEAQGFQSCEDVLRRSHVLFASNIVGAPGEDLLRTVRFEPGFAVLEAGNVHPRALVEGSIRGIVEMYGRFVTELRAETAEGPGGPLHRFTVRWE